MRLADLPTPCLVLDRAILRRNLQYVQAAARGAGVTLRLDMQGAKSIDLLRAVAERSGGAASGIAVSTLAEAEYFAAHDVTGILYAAGITASKLERAAALHAGGAAMLVATADAATAAAIAAHPAPLRALIRIGSGRGCGGLEADDPALQRIAEALGGRLAGIVATAPPAAAGVSSWSGLRRAAGLLAAEGYRLDIVCAGDAAALTPDAAAGPVTEVIGGACMFADRALTVLASVTGTARGRGACLLLDAGAVALAGGPGGEPCGMLLDLDGEARFGSATVRAPWAEQGLAMLESAEAPAVGARVRIALVDANLAAAAHDRYFVVDGGDLVAAIWPRIGGW